MERATVKALCPLHGEVELAPSKVLLIVAANRPDLSYYTFPCRLPSCGDVTKPADDGVVSLLMRGGVTPMVWEIPAELAEREANPPAGPAITEAEIYDFRLDLGLHDELAAHAAH